MQAWGTKKVFCCKFSEISKNTFFTEHLRTTASVINVNKIMTKDFPKKCYNVIRGQNDFRIITPLKPYLLHNFIKAWTHILRRFKSCSQRVGDSGQWGSRTVVPTGNKAKRLSLVNHTTKTIHHHYRHCGAIRIRIGNEINDEIFLL